MRQFAAIAWLAVIALVVAFSLLSTPARVYEATAEMILAVVIIVFVALALVGVVRRFSRRAN